MPTKVTSPIGGFLDVNNPEFLNRFRGQKLVEKNKQGQAVGNVFEVRPEGVFDLGGFDPNIPNQQLTGFGKELGIQLSPAGGSFSTEEAFKYFTTPEKEAARLATSNFGMGTGVAPKLTGAGGVDVPLESVQGFGEQIRAEFKGGGGKDPDVFVGTRAQIMADASAKGINPENLFIARGGREERFFGAPQETGEIKIPNRKTLDNLTQQGLSADDIIRRDAQGNIVATDGSIFIKPDSAFAKKLAPQAATGITGPIGADTLAASGIGDFLPPSPQADLITEQYFTGLKNTLDSVYKAQLETSQKNITALQSRIEAMTARQEEALKTAGTLAQPFQQDFVNAQRAKFQVEELYQNNLETISEMETILNSVIGDVRAAEQVTGLKSIRGPRIQKLKDDALGRVSILESVLAARNNQIELAESLIDKGLSAAVADQQDQIDYLGSVINFLTQAKKETQGELDIFRKDEEKTISSRIALIEGEIENQEATGDFIKKLLADDPQNAEMLSGAGVKLNDPIEVISQKMSKWLKQNPGFGQRGDVADLATKYPDAGITLNDTLVQAQAKVPSSRIYQQATRLAAGGSEREEKTKPEELTNEEKQFQKDLREQQKMLVESYDTQAGETDPEAWGIAWDTLKSYYPDIPNEVLDQLLNKEKYYPR